MSVTAMKWAESSVSVPDIRDDSGVYKASLAISYDAVELPDLTQASVGAMNKLLSGTFAFESAAYLYDFFVVRIPKEEQAMVEVYEFDLEYEGTCLRPKKRPDGAIPMWPGSVISGHEFLGEGQRSAIVFVFESAEENWCA
jgi:hypothetical protein